MLDGKKTYLVCGAMFLYAVGGPIFSYLDPKSAAEIIMAAGALWGMAHKLDKNTAAQAKKQ